MGAGKEPEKASGVIVALFEALAVFSGGRGSSRARGKRRRGSESAGGVRLGNPFCASDPFCASTMSKGFSTTRRRRLGGCFVILLLTIPLLLWLGPHVLRLAVPHYWRPAKARAVEARPIDFYGKVVDRQGRPIRNAEIHLLVITPNWPGALWAGAYLDHENVVLRSRPDGRFSFHKDKGTNIRIEEVEAEGYGWMQPSDRHGIELMPVFDFDQRSIRRGRNHVANPDDPYILRMKRTDRP